MVESKKDLPLFPRETGPTHGPRRMWGKGKTKDRASVKGQAEFLSNGLDASRVGAATHYRKNSEINKKWLRYDLPKKRKRKAPGLSIKSVTIITRMAFVEGRGIKKALGTRSRARKGHFLMG